MDADRPVSPNDVPAGDPIWAKFVQPAPWQRSRWYFVTLTLSVDAGQLRSIWVSPREVAVREAGSDGAAVSAATVMFTLVVDFRPLRSVALSMTS